MIPTEIANFFIAMQAGQTARAEMEACFAPTAIYEEPFSGEMRRHEGRAAVMAAMDAGLIPVVAPIGVDDDGVSHNVNADEAAGAIAAALGAEKLILLTDVDGVLDAAGELISELSVEACKALIGDGTIKGGMIPKMECCMQALSGGVKRTHVVDGRIQHAVLLEIFSDDAGVGTLLRS